MKTQVTVTLNPELMALVAKAKKADPFKAVSAILRDAAIVGLLQVHGPKSAKAVKGRTLERQPLILPVEEASTPLDGLIQRVGEAVLAVNPEGLEKVIAENNAEIAKLSEPPKSSDLKIISHGVNPIVQTEIKAKLYDPAALGEPISFLSPDLVTKPESIPKANVEPAEPDPEEEELAALFSAAEEGHFVLEEE